MVKAKHVNGAIYFAIKATIIPQKSFISIHFAALHFTSLHFPPFHSVFKHFITHKNSLHSQTLSQHSKLWGSNSFSLLPQTQTHSSSLLTNCPIIRLHIKTPAKNVDKKHENEHFEVQIILVNSKNSCPN
jgi:hypothetical protein